MILKLFFYEISKTFTPYFYFTNISPDIILRMDCSFIYIRINTWYFIEINSATEKKTSITKPIKCKGKTNQDKQKHVYFSHQKIGSVFHFSIWKEGDAIDILWEIPQRETKMSQMYVETKVSDILLSESLFAQETNKRNSLQGWKNNY